MCCLKDDLIKARTMFDTGKYTCVLCKGNKSAVSCETGVKPLVGFIESKKDYSGWSAADKIIGRAAAHLYILIGVAAVHGSVMSKAAAGLLEKHQISVSYDTLTDSIINRKGNGICPMEKAVDGIDDSMTAFHKIKDTIMILKQR